MIKVSVIVPIYNVEKYIKRCVNSLFQQTMKEVEYIFIDDCTPDNSIYILKEELKEYPECNVKILSHESNRGLPAARNTGLIYASGEYIFHCDSDDWVEPDMLESLYNQAIKKDADIVWCDWWLSFKYKERYMKQPHYSTPFEALKGILSGCMKYNVWNKLIKHNLYKENHINFPSGYGMGEDMTIIRLFAFAKKITYVPKAYYHYLKQNQTAFSNTYSERHLIELKYNAKEIISFIEEKYGTSLENEIAFFKLEVKFPFLISNDKNKFELWKTWFPESNPYIPLNKTLSFRRKALQWFAWKGEFWIVRMYYVLCHRIYYGIILR